jgi:tetratricopeptide (TPR) repeat protein
MIKKYKEALADLNKSLNVYPNDACSLGRRGEVYRMMGKYEEALADLNKSLEIQPNDAWALCDCGTLLFW